MTTMVSPNTGRTSTCVADIQAAIKLLNAGAKVQLVNAHGDVSLYPNVGDSKDIAIDLFYRYPKGYKYNKTVVIYFGTGNYAKRECWRFRVLDWQRIVPVPQHLAWPNQ